MPSAEELLDLETNLSAVALALFTPGTVQAMLQKIVNLAERAVEGCEAAGIILVDGARVTTTAASSAYVVAVDQGWRAA